MQLCRPLSIAVLVAVFANSAFAGKFGKSCVACPQPCQPGAVIVQPVPADDGRAAPAEGQPPAEVAPDQSPVAGELSSALSGDFGSSMEVASSSGGRAPNMIGDFFGVTPRIDGMGRIFYSGDFSATLVNAQEYDFGGGFANYSLSSGGTIFVVLQGTGENFSVASPEAISQDVNNGVFLDLPYVSDANTFATAQAYLSQYIPGATLIQFSGQITNGQIEPASSGASGEANVAYSGNGVIEAQVPILLILPSGGRPGAQVGLMKVSENNAVLPADRLIFNYNSFFNVPLSPTGVNVNRISPGFEKTFFDQRASVQVMFPIAGTTSASQNLGTFEGDTVFGNIQTIVKYLAYRSQKLNVGIGLGIESPTANDAAATLADGTTLLRVRNEAVRLQPFIGALFTPNDRFFVQSFIQVDVDPNGNTVLGNPDLNGLRSFGTLYGQPLFLFDTQVGYWFYRNDDPCSWIRGISGILEWHYNQSLTSTSNTVGFEGLVATNIFSDFSLVNMTVGSTVQMGSSLELMLGMVFPLTSDRSFDFEAAAYVNYYFGKSRNLRTPRTF